MSTTTLLPVVALAVLFLLLFTLLLCHEFRVHARIKAASARLEGGKARPGYLFDPGRRLPK